MFEAVGNSTRSDNHQGTVRLREIGAYKPTCGALQRNRHNVLYR
jgi:hypothetical protein